VGLGYWGDPRLTCQRFVPDPWVAGAVMYKSGDLVKWQESGDLLYVGRVDEQIKLRGFRIEPGEIEARLLEHSLVGQCAVVVSGDRLVAYYTSLEPVDDTALKAHLRDTLPHYMVPDHLVFIEHLPLTRNGKIDRHQLTTHTPTPTPPQPLSRNGTEREEVVHQIFAAVLRVPEVGPDDGFSDLGGNSITAMTLASKLRRAGYNVTARDILHCQTIDKLLKETSEPTIVSAGPRDADLVLQPGMNVDGDVARVLNDSFAINNGIIMGAPVIKDYPMSAMQKLQIGFGTPASLAIEPLERVLDLPALQKAYGAVIAQHGLLRSVPVESGGSHAWREYDYRADEVPLIPVINISECAEPEFSMQALLESLTTRVYKGAKILHQLVIAVVDGNKYFLVWIMSHVIFDRVTKEVLSRQLVRHYDALLQGQPLHTEAPSFEDYVHRLARGPQGVEARDIVRLFRLKEFYEAKQKMKHLVTTTGSPSSTNFNIVLPLSTTWQLEHPWEIALAVHVKGLQRYLQMDQLPLLFVTEGRQFEDQRYYDTVGELTDMIPLFVNARMPLPEITQSILDRLEFVKRHNVNFLHLATEPAAQAQWSDIARLMDVGEDFENLDILMFNILGYTDESSVESVVETSWVHPQPLPIQTLLNAITSVCSETLVCAFRTSCAVDVPRIRACFKDAASELS
ncbi:AMP-binding enzyme, partial [Mycobacterium montefiorense]